MRIVFRIEKRTNLRNFYKNCSRREINGFKDIFKTSKMTREFPDVQAHVEGTTILCLVFGPAAKH